MRDDSNGKHGLILEAPIQRVGNVGFAGNGGQCSSYEGGAGSKDRRAGRGMDRRPAPTRITQSKLHSQQRAARTAGTGSVPQEPHRRPWARIEPPAEDAGGWQH